MAPAYYPIQRKWRQLRLLFELPEVLELMHSEMECYACSRAEDNGYEHTPTPFTPALRPAAYDSLDWRFEREDGSYRRGPSPGYWAWACAGACHWVVNYNLEVVSTFEPERPWQIVESEKHSTVVDVERKIMFDTNFQAMGISAQECWDMAMESSDSELLPVGMWLEHRDSEPLEAQRKFKIEKERRAALDRQLLLEVA